MAKARSVLGKGLSALIPTGPDEFTDEQVDELSRYAEAPVRLNGEPSGHAPEAVKSVSAMIAKIEIAKVAPNPLQPRKDFPTDALAELVQSIREHGIIQAITVRSVGDDRYELVSGERRVRAAIEAGLTEIPAYVLDVDSDRKMLEFAIIENVQRLQFNPIEEAEAYQKLIDACGLTQEDVAEKIAKDRSTVSNFLRLLRLPAEIQESLRKEELGLGHAKAIMGVADPARQIALWDEAVRNKYSVRKLEELVRASETPRTPRPKKEAEPAVSSEARAMEDSLKRVLGTQVKLRVKPDHTGEIVIQFYNYDDLDRLHELLASIHPA
jgi:ParB family chromosome partitioning protein